ncbi:hypothetical protein B0T11DRAFT_88790 [Plectosphaerella cucumerina]|uniref:Uncharacterized protein n=1 Tax=Plectosphaerella cucumerina TaxID=40658 RepID=A0A8K0TE27_9PEZI|nr:hypothetical protein B0T11DRAFT_88790 [Plectosphaerella cucumerina]
MALQFLNWTGQPGRLRMLAGNSKAPKWVVLLVLALAFPDPGCRGANYLPTAPLKTCAFPGGLDEDATMPGRYSASSNDRIRAPGRPVCGPCGPSPSSAGARMEVVEVEPAAVLYHRSPPIPVCTQCTDPVSRVPRRELEGPPQRHVPLSGNVPATPCRPLVTQWPTGSPLSQSCLVTSPAFPAGHESGLIRDAMFFVGRPRRRR